MAALLAVIPAAIAAASAYALNVSWVAIQDVRHYEEPTKKAAKHSNIAEDTLHQTTTTEAAGAVATALSLGTSLTLTITAFTTSTPRPFLAITSSVLCSVAAFAASDHIHGFWRNKAKIPLVDKFNEGIDKTNGLRRMLGWLALAWFAEAWIRGFAMLA